MSEQRSLFTRQPTFDEYCPEPKPKHDEACLRRRADRRMRFLCTCGMSDKQVRGLFEKRRVDR
jgi:hypothetical protein